MESRVVRQPTRVTSPVGQQSRCSEECRRQVAPLMFDGDRGGRDVAFQWDVDHEALGHRVAALRRERPAPGGQVSVS